jgi:hypothetical protein
MPTHQVNGDALLDPVFGDRVFILEHATRKDELRVTSSRVSIQTSGVRGAKVADSRWSRREVSRTLCWSTGNSSFSLLICDRSPRLSQSSPEWLDWGCKDAPPP